MVSHSWAFAPVATATPNYANFRQRKPAPVSTVFVAHDHHPTRGTNLAPKDFPAPGWAGIREREAGPDGETAPYSSPGTLQGVNGPITLFLGAGSGGAAVLRPKGQGDRSGARRDRSV